MQAATASSQVHKPTRWWRKTDSNYRSLSGRIRLFRLVLPAGGVEEACSEKPPVLRGDRQFESVFLQRRVNCEPDFRRRNLDIAGVRRYGASGYGGWCARQG